VGVRDTASCLQSLRDISWKSQLGILHGDQWVEEIGEGLMEVKVRVKQPAVEHRVRMKDFRRW